MGEGRKKRTTPKLRTKSTLTKKGKSTCHGRGIRQVSTEDKRQSRNDVPVYVCLRKFSGVLFRTFSEGVPFLHSSGGRPIPSPIWLGREVGDQDDSDYL